LKIILISSIQKSIPFLFDYDLHYKKEIRSRTSIDIPSNYTVTFLPESIKYVNSDFNSEINFEIINNQIIYNKTINIPNGLIHQTNKEEWNKALKELIEVYNSNIILKKS
jgi:hypothetical protein